MTTRVTGVKLVIGRDSSELFGVRRTARDTRYLSGKVKLPGGFSSKSQLKKSLAVEVAKMFEIEEGVQPNP